MYKLLLCWLSFLVFAILSASGCGSVVTEQPLSEAGKALVDESMVGVWQELDFTPFARELGEPSGLELIITLKDDGSYRIVGRDRNEKEDWIFEGKCFEFEGKTFFSPTRLLQRVSDKLVDVSEQYTVGTLFISLTLQRDELEVRAPDPEAFAKLLERSDKLDGTATGWLSKKVIITSPPADLAREVLKHFDILFEEPTRYRRKTDKQAGTPPEEINNLPVEAN